MPSSSSDVPPAGQPEPPAAPARRATGRPAAFFDLDKTIIA
jgi:hypothetical protein